MASRSTTSPTSSLPSSTRQSGRRSGSSGGIGSHSNSTSSGGSTRSGSGFAGCPSPKEKQGEDDLGSKPPLLDRIKGAMKCPLAKMATASQPAAALPPLLAEEKQQPPPQAADEQLSSAQGTVVSSCNVGVGGSATVCFSHPEQLQESFERLNDLRSAEQLCDVVLEADGVRFPCHRAVLAASCPYFCAMFAGQMCEAQMPAVAIPNVRSCVLRLVLDFAYTGRVALCERSVCPVLVAAAMLQMQRLVDACSTYLAGQLDPSNCIGIRRFARTHGCAALVAKAECFVLGHFCEVLREDEFRSLSACELRAILSSEGLAVRCEMEVFGAVIDWAAHDPSRRQTELKRLLASVRLCAIPPQFIAEQLTRCDLLRGSDDCVAYLGKVLDELTIHKPDACADGRPRPAGYALVVFCVGGYQRCSTSIVDFYCPLMRVWHRAAEMPSPRSGLAACVLQGVLYAIGGRNNSACPTAGGGRGVPPCEPAGCDIDSSAVDAFEPSANAWSQVPPMSVARSRVGAGVLDGQLYAVGGSCGPDSHASVERYNPKTRQWTTMPSMNVPRNAVGVAVVNRFLYAVGGSNGQVRLNTMECFHPERGEWIACPPMSTPRSGAGVCALNDYIYVAGGYDSSEQLSSVERFDTRTNTWQLVRPMKRARSALSMASWNGKLFVLGGYGLSEFIAAVECYTPETDTWCDVTTMPHPRSGLGVAVGILPNLCSS